jgi:hypothetical protein
VKSRKNCRPKRRPRRGADIQIARRAEPDLAAQVRALLVVLGEVVPSAQARDGRRSNALPADQG